MNRESDLLFGLLALQMNFISKEQLLEAAAVWMNDPDRGFPRLLQDRGFLKDFEHAAVKMMVEAHLKRNAGDAARSLASVGVEAEIRHTLLRMGPPKEVGQSLAGLIPRDPVGAIIVARAEARRYELGKEIGQGGLGRVVEAEDRNLEREVAIKMILNQASAHDAQRFAREAKITARLDHPNVIPVHDFGEMEGEDGRRVLYIAMKRIRGRDLAVLLRKLRGGDPAATRVYSRARLLAVFQDICQGVAFAHDHDVIHRDLKPSNVMIGDYGETLILDWGLARTRGEGTGETGPDERDAAADLAPGNGVRPEPGGVASTPDLTFDGQILGTPAYMSPEQAEGKWAEVDARSDIYSLGAILYEILTLRPPFEGDSLDEVLGKVRSGKVEAPSSRIGRGPRTPRAAPQGDGPPAGPWGRTVLRPPSTYEVLGPVPPELDQICLKAMSFAKVDRHASALELRDDIQAFLEGSRERERALAEARRRVKEGRESLAKYRQMKAKIVSQEEGVREWMRKIRPHEPVEKKWPLWQAEILLKAMRDDRIQTFSRASAAFGQALAADPFSREAADGKCELFSDRYGEAEERRDREEMLLSRDVVAQYDWEGSYQARLRAPGRLSIRTFSYECGCLDPLPAGGWRMEVAPDLDVPWREGRPRPDLPLTDSDRPVPRVSFHPPEIQFGHGRECRRREVSGVEVRIARYEEQGKRLVLSSQRLLGVTPLAEVEAPKGSYRVTLGRPGDGTWAGPVHVPIRMDRDGRWEQEVNLYRPRQVPEGFRYVPGGPFLFGGEHADAGTTEVLRTQDLFVARAPVTCREYLEFLNDLAATDRLAEARGRQPRDGDQRFFLEEGGRFAVRQGEEEAILTSEDLPVMGVSWRDATAYASWRSAREGRVYRLLHEEEFEKAARGVDGRVRPWGDEWDGTFSNTSVTHAGGPRLLPPGTFPVDESPYGILDLAGNIMTWCWNTPEVPFRHLVCCRGGTWGNSPKTTHPVYRGGRAATFANLYYGFRLCVSAERVV